MEIRKEFSLVLCIGDKCGLYPDCLSDLLSRVAAISEGFEAISEAKTGIAQAAVTRRPLSFERKSIQIGKTSSSDDQALFQYVSLFGWEHVNAVNAVTSPASRVCILSFYIFASCGLYSIRIRVSIASAEPNFWRSRRPSRNTKGKRA